jgi:hypothetical protein
VRAGHARSLLTQDSNVLVQPGVMGQIAHAGVTGAHATAAAADNLALIMDDSNLWDGMRGGPNCTVTCNGEAGSLPFYCGFSTQQTDAHTCAGVRACLHASSGCWACECGCTAGRRP